MPGLETVDRVVAPQECVAITLFNVVVGELTDRMPLIKFRKVRNDRSRQHRQVACAADMAFGRQAGGIAEIAGMHAESRCVLIHHFGKYAFSSGNVLGKRDARVVAGLNDHAEQQVVHGYLTTHFYEHSGARGSPGDLADSHFIVETDGSPLQGTENDVRRHYLRQTSRRELHVRIHRCNFTTRCAVDDQVTLGPDDGWGRDRQGRGSASIGCTDNDYEQERKIVAWGHNASAGQRGSARIVRGYSVIR